MKKARSRRQSSTSFKKQIKHVAAGISTVFLIGAGLYAGFRYFTESAIAAAPGYEPQVLIKQVEVIKEVEVDRTFKTQKQQIMAYLVEVFGDDADDAITVLNKCENSSFNPEAVNHNANGTCDVGVMQINVACEGEEFEKLKDWKYNIQRGYAKFKAGDGGKHKNSFYLWTCGYEVGHYTYLNRLRGE